MGLLHLIIVHNKCCLSSLERGGVIDIEMNSIIEIHLPLISLLLGVVCFHTNYNVAGADFYCNRYILVNCVSALVEEGTGHMKEANVSNFSHYTTIPYITNVDNIKRCLAVNALIIFHVETFLGPI